MRRSGYGIGIRLAAVLTAAAAVCLLISGCAALEKRKQYDAGVGYYNQGEYELAKEYFLAAEDYGNTQEYLDAIKECENRYAQAAAMVDEHRYVEAYAVFESIPKYLNSTEFMRYIDGLRAKYERGVALYGENKYLAARTSFAEANGYSTSDTYIDNIDAMAELYNRAMEYMNGGDYESAISAFDAINADFEDTNARIEECAAALVDAPTGLKAFRDNYNAEYMDDSVSIDTGTLSSQFALSDTQGVLITGLADENEHITYISFWFSPSLIEQLGERGYNEAVAHCIHALNPYICDYESVVANLSKYLDGLSDYGCMRFSAREDESGSTVVEAVLVTGVE